MSEDGRPRLAVGHVNLEVEDVGDTYDFFVNHGMRDIFRSDDFGVLELRGGTHLVLSRAKAAIEPGREAPFDLMVDDIDEARAEFSRAGVAATGNHAWPHPRHLPHRGSSGYRMAVTSSHAGRPRGMTCKGKP